MDEENKIQEPEIGEEMKGPTGSEENQSNIASDRVFDISGDNIMPVNDEAPKITPDIPKTVPIQVTLKTPDSKTLPSSIPTTPIQQTVNSQIQPASNPIQKPSSQSNPKFPNVPKANIKQLRTYETDVADILSRTNTSRASIAIAENSRGKNIDTIGNTETGKESHQSGKKILYALISLILLGGGIFVAYYLYNKSPLAQKPVAPIQNTQPTSIIPVDTSISIPINGLVASGVILKIQKEALASQKINSIKAIIPTNTNGTTVEKISAQNMLKILGISAPNILVRSLGTDYTIGIYNDASEQKSLFVVLTSDFFQNTFAGMLQWEKVMADDLKQYLYKEVRPEVVTDQNSTTTTNQYFTIRGQFHDRIVKNKDVREFINENNQILFLYSFIDNKRLVIAPNEAVLAEIISRLEKQAFVR